MRSFPTAMPSFPYPEERSAGARLEGRTDGRAGRLDKAGSAAKSPRISASFFSPAPPFYLPFRSDRIFDLSEFLLEGESDRSPTRRITVENSGLMLREALIKAAARRADVVRAIGAAQNVEMSAHSAPPATARSISASKFAAMA
jgi:hypothetical protein